MQAQTGENYTPEEIEAALSPLVENYLILKSKAAYLSLALPMNKDYRPPAPIQAAINKMSQQLGLQLLSREK